MERPGDGAAGVCCFRCNCRSACVLFRQLPAVFLWSIIPYLGNMLLILSYPKELDFSCDEGSCSGDKKRGWKDALKTIRDFFGLFRDKTVRKALVNSSLFDAVFQVRQGLCSAGA